MEAADWAAIDDVTDGLENRLARAAQSATSLEELYTTIKTKRYTHARIRRIVLRAYLGIGKGDYPATPPYLRVLDAMVADGLDMVFAGHTHGGQICLPMNRAIVANCDIPLRQASGLSSWSSGGQTAPLHVSAGIGTSPMAPIRLFCRPSATLLRLVPRT